MVDSPAYSHGKHTKKHGTVYHLPVRQLIVSSNPIDYRIKSGVRGLITLKNAGIFPVRKLINC